MTQFQLMVQKAKIERLELQLAYEQEQREQGERFRQCVRELTLGQIAEEDLNGEQNH